MVNMKLMKNHKKIFKKDKPIIGCLHLMPLPGSPYYDKNISIEDHIERLKREAKTLMELGYDAVVFANEGDRPYLEKVGPEIVATYVRIVTEVLPYIDVPYGCGVLIDPEATLAVAKAIGAQFIRTYVSNSYVGTFGKQDFFPGEIFRYKNKIDADDVNVYTYFEPHAGISFDNRKLSDQISSGFAAMPIEGMIIGGDRAGFPPAVSTLKKIKNKFPNYPLIMGSGANANNISDLLEYSDGVIVGTTLKKDSYLYNEIDYDRAKDFITAARKK